MSQAVIGYCRVSVKEKDTGSCSLQSQCDNMVAYAAANKLVIHDVLQDDGESGGKSLRSRARGKVAMEQACLSKMPLLVEKLDRAFRRTRDYCNTLHDLHRADSYLISAAEPYDLRTPTGYMMGTIVVAVAERELESIGERIRARLKTRRDSGQRSSSEPPYGYFFMVGPPRADGTTGPMLLCPNAVEQRVIRRILGWRQAKKSYGWIADQLTAEGVTTRRGGPWGRTSVFDIAKEGRKRLERETGEADGDVAILPE